MTTGAMISEAQFRAAISPDVLYHVVRLEAAAAVASFVIALPTEERLVAVYRRYCTAASLR
jgi:hypothetical protein